MAHRGKPGEIPIQAHHGAVMLHGDGREYRVRYQVARCVGLVAEFSQQHEVSGAGACRKVMGLGGDGVDECEGQVDTWPRTGAGVKNGDGWPGAAGAGGGELPPKGVFDHSAQRLTTLAGSAFGGSQ